MKVLFLTKYDLQKFGIAEPLSALSAALGKLGVDVTVYSSDPSARAGRMGNGQPCIYGPMPRPHLLMGHLAARHIARLCRREGFELIHCHGLYRPGWAARAVRRLADVPYVVTSWGDIVPTSSRQQRWSVRRRCRKILADAAAVVHPTSVIAEYSRALGRGPTESIIPNGIDLDRWRSTQQQCPPRRLVQGPYILAVGKLVEQKGFQVLIRAMAQPPLKGGDARLVIAGDGPDAAAFKTLARELGLNVAGGLDAISDAPAGSICFAGFVDFATKVHLYRDAAAVAFSSQYGEGFPGVLLEAMAAGKAIVASDIPATRAIVGRDSAIFVPPPQEQAWAKTMGEVLDDDERRAMMEKTNGTKVEQFAWTRVAQQFAEVYRAILDGVQGRQTPRPSGRTFSITA
ncbi:MAG: glycosyltransferase family 4 protein [Planctomycetaceae bacterium]|nr:glycosyltransferase family 4 protein [Planctomycetaceae bacterium]